MAATPLDSKALEFRRKMCIGTFTFLLPTYYTVRRRNDIFKASKLVREFYLKEILVRTVLGFIVGVGMSI